MIPGISIYIEHMPSLQKNSVDAIEERETQRQRRQRAVNKESQSGKKSESHKRSGSILTRRLSMTKKRNYRKRPLTDRDKAVVQGIARGLTNAQIARELNISATAVEGRVNSIYDKLLLGSDVTREQLPECVRQ